MTPHVRPSACALAAFGLALVADTANAAGPPLDLLPQRVAASDAAPPAEAPPTEASPADPPPEDGGFVVEDEGAEEDLSDVETVEPESSKKQPEAKPPAETPPEDDTNWSFDVVDLTEDEAALAKELEVKKVEVKGDKGTVSGKLKDAVTGEPLVGAEVEAIGTKFKTKTGIDGSYTLDVPPGNYDLRFRYDTSQPLRVANVVVAKDGTVSLSRDLLPLKGAGETVKVEGQLNRESAGARLLQRKKSISTRDLMSREDISKSGGGSTSAVARRIVGATVVDGKYLFIRGLGHRYGNTLLDGARVPSPEPELRTVPLDIFPSGALSAINIQKTFTPDVPADFAGGSTQLETREVPDKLLIEIEADIQANTATTGRSHIASDRYAGADAFGFGNIPRALPSEIPGDTKVSRNLTDPDNNFQRVHSDEDIERYGESINTDTQVHRRKAAAPNFGAKATVGWGKDIAGDGSNAGFLVSAGYANKRQTWRSVRRLYGLGDNGQLQTDSPQVAYDGEQFENSTSWAGMALAKATLRKNHKLSLLGFYSREGVDETRYLDGFANTVSGDAPVINTRNRYIMRSILLTRLGGIHTFPEAKNLKLDWFGSYAQARRDDPSMRDMLYSDADADGEYALDTTNGGGKVLFLDLVDNTESGALNLTTPFKQWKQLESMVKFGGWVEGKQRDFQVRRFAYNQVSGLMPVPGLGDVLTDDTIGGGSPSGTQPYYVNETTRGQDNYTANQEIYAGYAMLDLPIVRWFQIAGGARFEASRIHVAPFDPFANPDDPVDPDVVSNIRLNDNDVLPAANFIFSPREDMKVRLVGTQTLARPEFRELAPFEFTDFVGGQTVIGNPALTSTKIWNADARWEWFPSSQEVIAASVFYKYFDDPIERVAQPRAGGLVSFRNAASAQNVGVELELRKNLEFMGPAVRNFSLGANFAYIYSRVKLGGQCSILTDPTCDPTTSDVSTSRERPLQGQSPFVLNLYLDYSNKKSGTEGRLLYNSLGRRIDRAMGLGAPDIYEEARHFFDLIISQKVYKELEVSIAVTNILNWPIRFTQGPDKSVVETTWPGTSFRLGVGWKY